MSDENGNQNEYEGYADLNGLRDGYRNSSEEGKRQRQRADQAEQRARELEQAFQQSLQRGNGNTETPYSRLQTLGIPQEDLRSVIREEAQSISQQMFAPIARGMQARQELLSRYPDYTKFESDVAQFVHQDPVLNQSYEKMFAADPVGAMDYAFTKFTATQKSNARGNGAPRAPKSEAQLPSNRTGDARTTSGDTRDQAREGWEHYQKTGNPVPFAKARLRETIRSEFLGE